MVWDQQIINEVTSVKKSILKKKIMLGIIIESYTFKNKTYKFFHMLTALATVGSAFADNYTINTGNSSQITVILGCIAAALIKLKDYLNYDEIKNLAKQQTIKYEQLFQKIDKELRKPVELRQADEEFIYWITNSFEQIEMADPEMPSGLKNKYIEFCKSKGIPYDEDIEALELLIKQTVEPNTVNLVVDPKLTIEMRETRHARNGSIFNRARADSDKLDKVQYQEKMKNYDSTKDLAWAIERMEKINE